MIKKEPLVPDRIRKIEGGFGWIPRRFVTDGYIQMCEREESLTYFFLSIVADRLGLSFYGDKTMCKLLHLTEGDLADIRGQLEKKAFIAYQKPLYQVLSLPPINPGGEYGR